MINDYTHGGNIYKASRDENVPIKKIKDFSANINPIGLSPLGLKSIRKNLNNILNYPDPEYLSLKKSLSQFYNVDIENIVLGNGAIELIYIFSHVKYKLNCKALIPAPGFVEYEKALISEGWKIDFYKTKSDIHSNNIDVVFVCNPNNPTGKSFSENYLLKLLKRCKSLNIDLFIDEAFIDFSSYHTMAKYINEFDNLYILKSLTKFFGIPGLRLGCILTKNLQFRKISRELSIPWKINSVAEDYIKAALLDNKYINKSIRFNKVERYQLYKGLSSFKHLKVFRSQGNYIFFKNLTDIDLVSKLKEKSILVRNCWNYNNLDYSYYRVSINKTKQNKILLNELKKIFQ